MSLVFTIGPDTTIRDALATINQHAAQIVFAVSEDGKLLGSISDGDIRRGLLRGVGLDAPASEVMNDAPATAPKGMGRHQLIQLMQSRAIRRVPEIDAEGHVVTIHALETLLKGAHRDNWVVLMAGGLGSRLGELTRTTPKPLLDVGGKPILETIMKQFIAAGFERFFISVNYKAEMIEDYFGDGSRWGVRIEYLRETMRTGTAGSLSLLRERPVEPVFVMNGDILTGVDPLGILDFHNNTHSDMTMCVRQLDYKIDFGVVETSGNRVIGLTEKPTHTYLINAGVYLIAPRAFDFVPDQPAFFDMTTLIESNIEAGRRVSPFLVHEYWRDIGNVDGLARAREEYAAQFGEA